MLVFRGVKCMMFERVSFIGPGFWWWPIRSWPAQSKTSRGPRHDLNDIIPKEITVKWCKRCLSNDRWCTQKKNMMIASCYDNSILRRPFPKIRVIINDLSSTNDQPINESMDEWMNEWMNESVNQSIHVFIYPYIHLSMHQSLINQSSTIYQPSIHHIL